MWRVEAGDVAQAAECLRSMKLWVQAPVPYKSNVLMPESQHSGAGGKRLRSQREFKVVLSKAGLRVTWTIGGCIS